MTVTLITRLVTRPAIGLPPKAHRPGAWRPGTCAEVTATVRASALHAATLRYFLNPTAGTWADLMAAQVTADACH